MAEAEWYGAGQYVVHLTLRLKWRPVSDTAQILLSKLDVRHLRLEQLRQTCEVALFQLAKRDLRSIA
jgi:hypothetical protein